MVQIFSFLFIILFFTPVLIFSSQLGSFSIPEFSNWAPSFLVTLAHSAAASTLAALGGVFGGLALAGVKEGQKKNVLQIIALIPGFVPQIVVLTSVFMLTSFLGIDFRGLGAVIFIHVLINIGICSVAMEHLLKSKIQSQISLCLIDGVSRATFILKVLFPLFCPEKFLRFGCWFFVFVSRALGCPSFWWDPNPVLKFSFMRRSK